MSENLRYKYTIAYEFLTGMIMSKLNSLSFSFCHQLHQFKYSSNTVHAAWNKLLSTGACCLGSSNMPSSWFKS